MIKTHTQIRLRYLPVGLSHTWRTTRKTAKTVCGCYTPDSHSCWKNPLHSHTAPNVGRMSLGKCICSNKRAQTPGCCRSSSLVLVITNTERSWAWTVCCAAGRSGRKLNTEKGWLSELNMENHFRALWLKIILVGLTWTTLVTSPLAPLHTGLQKYVEGF